MDGPMKRLCIMTCPRRIMLFRHALCSTSNDNATIHIPNVDIDEVHKKIKEIIASADCDELTIKGVRKILEKWLGMRLSKYHWEIKALIVDAM
jgi:hypothetical protein